MYPSIFECHWSLGNWPLISDSSRPPGTKQYLPSASPNLITVAHNTTECYQLAIRFWTGVLLVRQSEMSINMLPRLWLSRYLSLWGKHRDKWWHLSNYTGTLSSGGIIRHHASGSPGWTYLPKNFHWFVIRSEPDNLMLAMRSCVCPKHMMCVFMTYF